MRQPSRERRPMKHRRVPWPSPALVLPLTLGLLLLSLVAGAQGTAEERNLLDRARALDQGGDPMAATDLYQQAITQAEGELGATSPLLALLLEEAGLVYQRAGDDATAEGLHRRALQVMESIVGPEHPDLVPYLGTLAGLLSRLGSSREAEALYLRALPLLESQLEVDADADSDLAREIAADVAANTSAVLGHLGNLALHDQRLSQARDFYQRAITVGRGAGPGAAAELAVLHNNLAALELRSGRGDTAVAHYRHAIELAEAGLGPNHPAVGFSLDQLAALHLDAGRIDQALPLAERALTIAERHAPENSPEVAHRRMLLDTLRRGRQSLEAQGEDSVAAATEPETTGTSPADTASASVGTAIGDLPAPTPGNFWVQVASRPDHAEALRELQRLRTAHPQLLANLGARVVTAHLGDKGVWHRVQWGGFGDRQAAARLCQALRGAGSECFVWQARGSG